MEKRLKEMSQIMEEQNKKIAGKQLPPLDPEVQTLAKHKRETFDVVNPPVDPLR